MPVDQGSYLDRAGINGGILFFHGFKDIPVLGVDHVVIQRALHHVVHVGDEPVVVEVIAVYGHVQFLFDDVRGLLDDGTVVDIRRGFRLRLIVDKVQGDGGGFLPGKGDPQPLFEDLQRLFSHLGFLGVKLTPLLVTILTSTQAIDV